MKIKKACLVINPRAGENLALITELMSIFAAAGWKTDLELKVFGGQTLELAERAAEKGYDMVIAFGGDGTLNQVVNGVMNAKGQKSVIGLIPGGTANVWANEISVPSDKVKAALTLLNSEERKVDVGHVEVESLVFRDEHGEERVQKVKATSKARHHFLLMAGLGIDAAVMSGVDKSLKYQVGPFAVGISALKELPKQHPFPVEIRAESSSREGKVLWQGEALQIVVGNSRKYADVLEMTPNAYIDDGVLDICVITAGDPLSTLEQVTSLVLRRKLENFSTEFFHGAHFTIRVPASVHLQLDGSAVDLKDYLSKADRKLLKEGADLDQIMVNYRIDAMPKALRVAIPTTYDNTLFEHPHHFVHPEPLQEQQNGQKQEQQKEQQDEQATNEEQAEVPGFITHLLEDGRKVKVSGVSPDQWAKKPTVVIAGTSPKKSTGEAKPAAVHVTEKTKIYNRNGAQLDLAIITQLMEGAEITVEGKKSDEGVIDARRIVL